MSTRSLTAIWLKVIDLVIIDLQGKSLHFALEIDEISLRRRSDTKLWGILIDRDRKKKKRKSVEETK